MDTTPLIETRGVTRRFGHVEALRGVDFVAHAGEVSAIVGDNGAGKSTFIKILSGALQCDTGEVLFHGRPVNLTSPHHARDIQVSRNRMSERDGPLVALSLVFCQYHIVKSIYGP